MIESEISLAQQFVIALQVLLAAFFSMVVGFNRERRDKDAGLRTHMLVGTGACVFSALSIMAFPESESGRVAANVVTGVGFLGAGVIWRGNGKVQMWLSGTYLDCGCDRYDCRTRGLVSGPVCHDSGVVHSGSAV